MIARGIRQDVLSNIVVQFRLGEVSLVRELLHALSVSELDVKNIETADEPRLARTFRPRWRC